MTNINIRISDETNERANELFKSLGMDMSTAVNIFLHQCIEFNGLPFAVQHRFNAETEAALKESNDIAEGRIQAKKYTDVHAMFEEILAEGDDE